MIKRKDSTMETQWWNTGEVKQFIVKEKYEPPFFTEKKGIKDRRINPRRLVDPILRKEENSRSLIKDVISEIVSLHPDTYRDIPEYKRSRSFYVTSTQDRFAVFKDEKDTLQLIEDFADSTFRVVKNSERWMKDILR